MDTVTRFLLSLVTSAREAASFDGGEELDRLRTLVGGRHCLRILAREGQSAEYWYVRRLSIALHALSRAVRARQEGEIREALEGEREADRLLSDLEADAQRADDYTERMHDACHGDSE